MKELKKSISKEEVYFWSIILISIVLFLTVCDESFFEKIFNVKNTYLSYLYHHTTLFILWGATLFFLNSPFKENYSFINWKTGGSWCFIACLISTVPVYISSFDPEFLKEYPLALDAYSSKTNFFVFHLSYLLYYIGWENFFRGFIQKGAINLGMPVFRSIMLQTTLSTVIHIGKPMGELIGAIPGGIFMGFLAYRTKSLIWPILFHFYVGLINSYFCWLHQ